MALDDLRGLRFWIFLVVLVFGPATVRCEPPPVSLKLSLTVAFAPASLTVRVRIPPDPSNREVCVTMYVDGDPAQSCWTLDGAHEPALFIRSYRRLPSGSYILIASLRRTDRTVYTPPAKLLVSSGA